MKISRRQRKCWNDYGYVVFKGFFNEPEIDVVDQALIKAWRQRPPQVTIDDLDTGERLRPGEVVEEELDRDLRLKVNDLYLVDPAVRAVASSARVVSVVAELLGDQPVVCNTLNLEQGSQQPDHLDTLYMTPSTDYQLVATWMALEDTHPDAGPLRYWPGSHKIEPYRFSTGLLHEVPEEWDAWSGYMADSVAHKGLEAQYFLASRGDLFIWNALLLHGGSEICNIGLSRKSMVTHFWSKTDCDTHLLKTHPVENGAGLWLERSPQRTPADVTALGEQEAT